MHEALNLIGRLKSLGVADVAAAVAGSGTGHEPWAIVQGVQSVLDAVHTTTGMPWWATLLVGELRQLGRGSREGRAR